MDPDTHALSPAELEQMKGLDDSGNPPEDDNERLNRETLGKNTDGTPATDDEGDGTDPADETAVVAAPAPAPAPVAATPAAPAAPAAPAPPAVVEVAAPAVAEAATEDDRFVPQYRADVPADAADQIKALTKEERDAFDQLMDGTLDKDEYRAVKERTDAAVETLKTAVLTAGIFETANQQAAHQSALRDWTKSEGKSFAGFKDEGIDYKGKPALLAAYNHNLKTLGMDPANESRDATWFFNEAHARTKADLGLAGKAAAPAAAPTAAPAATPAAAPAPAARTAPDLSQIPPTLGRVPPAADPAIGSNDEFAHLANLNGAELEKAVARMTPEQQDRYLD